MSRVLTLAAPIVAEISNRAIPVGIMLALNVVALVAAYYLKLKDPSQLHKAQTMMSNGSNHGSGAN